MLNLDLTARGWLAVLICQLYDGLHAGLGMQLVLNDLTPFIHPGDLLVLAPEYSSFFNDSLEGDDLTLGNFWRFILKKCNPSMFTNTSGFLIFTAQCCGPNSCALLSMDLSYRVS